eukprot:TRINITY_DN3832_c0_g2_i2.p1 TRINITY_DN3832_c0_g2~~TRINITY_DN3832_c0_g2_i2.p1  ORF type:complete len:527 (-),score=54.82 TRINITY_DN3832_c0_g2_i2:180-1760(-)
MQNTLQLQRVGLANRVCQLFKPVPLNLGIKQGQGKVGFRTLSKKNDVRFISTTAQTSAVTTNYQGRQKVLQKEAAKVCILGGGFGGLYTAIKLEQLMWPRNKKPQVTLVDQTDRFVFKPMLYELLVETVQPWEVAPTFQELLAPYQIKLVKGKVSEVLVNKKDEPYEGKVMLNDGSCIEYDWLVVALGSEANLQVVEGAKEHAIPFCTYQDAVKIKDSLQVLKQEDRPHIAIVGGNYAGIELAGVISEAVGKERAIVTVYTASEDILPDAPPAQKESAREYLKQLGVQIQCGAGIQKVLQSQDNPDKKLIQLTQDESIEVDLVLWTAGQAPVTGDKISKYDAFPFPKTQRGLLKVEETLRVEDNPRVFALGDVSGFQVGQDALQPATAQVALQQADYAAWNIWSSINNRALLPFRYQHLGNMMSLGKLQGSVAVNLPVPYPISSTVNSSKILNGMLQFIGVKVEGGDQGITVEGPFGGIVRRAAYLYRQPTDEHRVRVGARWLQQGLKDAQDIAREFGTRLQTMRS